MISQTRMPPPSTAQKIWGWAQELNMLVRTAINTPTLDTSVARTGAPWRFSFPNAAGAKIPRAHQKNNRAPRDNENNMGAQRYKLAFMLDSAAVISTKFIAAAA